MEELVDFTFKIAKRQKEWLDNMFRKGWISNRSLVIRQCIDAQMKNKRRGKNE